MGLKRPRDFILTLEEDDIASQSETESEPEEVTAKNKKRKVDEELNPDFEFDGYGVLGGVKGIEDDGWGFKGVTGMRQGAGVDLDGIIARRRENLEVEEEEESVDSEEEDEDEEEGEDEAEDSGEDDEFKGFDDDEDLGTASRNAP